MVIMPPGNTETVIHSDITPVFIMVKASGIVGQQPAPTAAFHALLRGQLGLRVVLGESPGDPSSAKLEMTQHLTTNPQKSPEAAIVESSSAV
jgi:hypothetical protein